MNGRLYDFDITEALVGSVPVLVADMETREILWSTAPLTEMFGFIRYEIVGKLIEDLIPEEYRAKHVQHVENYNRDPKPRSMGRELILEGLKRNGEIFPVEISLTPWIISGRRCVVAVVHDMSTRVNAEG